MPEGHTIHRLAIRYRSLLTGHVVTVSSPQGRFADGAALVDGSVLTGTEAIGKHLLFAFAGGHTLHIHLGLYGKFTDGPPPVPPVVGEVRLRIVAPGHWLDLRGPAACELLTPPEVDVLRGRLGADPLRDDAGDGNGGDAAFARIRRSPTPIAALLLNQSVVAGTGLIFVTEVLFRAGIDPLTPGRSVTAAQWQELWADLRQLMKPAVAAGRIDTVRPEHTPAAMGRPPRVDRHGGEVYAYRRAGQPCLVCRTEIASGTLGGRNMYWCRACQS